MHAVIINATTANQPLPGSEMHGHAMPYGMRVPDG
jgi:hypothetical protein